jgi:hypothetical protein
MFKFWQRLFPMRYHATAKCKNCGAVRLKSGMVNDPVYGWFCDEDELNDFWLA